MTILQAIILGIVEGITEFLPISSTAHLIWASKILGIKQTEFLKFFEVFIQSGAILAVIFNYFGYVLKNKYQLKLIFVSFVPTAFVGFFLFNLIKGVFFQSYNLILLVFFFMGIVFILFEHFANKGIIKPSRHIGQMSYKEAFVIGLGQSLSVIPGVSRAGAVIITMMGRNFTRKDSAIYSFLLAVPTIIAASIFDLFKTDLQIIVDPNNIEALIVGFLVSFISAQIVIRWLIRYLQKNNLVGFGIYRIIATIILIILSL